MWMILENMNSEVLFESCHKTDHGGGGKKPKPNHHHNNITEQKFLRCEREIERDSQSVSALCVNIAAEFLFSN